MEFIDNMTKDELVEFYKNNKLTLRELLCVYKNLDKYFDKNSKLYYIKQHHRNIEKMIEEKAYKLSLKELECSKHKHPILERIYNFKLKISLNDFSGMSKDELIYCYCNLERSFENLLKIYVEMKHHDFKESDYDTVKEKLKEYAYDFSNKELISYRNDDNSYIIDELLACKKRINKKDLYNMTKDELEYVYNNNPSIEDLYKILDMMPKYNYEKRAYENVKNRIKNLVDDLDLNELIDLYNKLKDKYDVSIIDYYYQRKMRIINKNIENLDSDEIEEIIFDYDLSPSELLRCKHRLFQIDISDKRRDSILKDIEEYLDDALEDMDDVFELKKEAMIAEKYNVSPLVINRRIEQVNKGREYKRTNVDKVKNGDNVFFNIKYHNNDDNEDDEDLDLSPWEQELKDNGEYEDYNFEEENLEEDDYGYEDF